MPQKHVPDATRLHFRSKSMPMRIASSQRKTSNDVLDRLEKIIEEKKKAHPEGSCHQSNLPSMWNWNPAMS